MQNSLTTLRWRNAVGTHTSQICILNPLYIQGVLKRALWLRQPSESAFFGTPCSCMYPIIRNSVQILPRGTANWCVSVLTKLTFHMRGIVAQKLVRNIGQCASCRWWKTIISQTLVPMKMAAWINFLGSNAVTTLTMVEEILQFTKTITFPRIYSLIKVTG